MNWNWNIAIAIGSMNGIFTHIWLILYGKCIPCMDPFGMLQYCHPKFQVPKTEVLNRKRLFWGCKVSLT